MSLTLIALLSLAAPEAAAAPDAAAAPEDTETPGTADTAEGADAPADVPVQEEWDPIEPAATHPTPEAQPRAEPRPRAEPDDLPPHSARGSTAPALGGPSRPRYVGAVTRPWFIHAAAGGSRPIRNAEYDLQIVNTLQLEQSIGYHLHGEGSGSALALVTQQAFTENFNTYAYALRYQYDAAVHPQLGVFLTPMLTFGFRRVTDRGTVNFDVNCPPDVPIECEAETYNQATIQLGLGVTVVIADRLPLFIRPINLDLTVPSIQNSNDTEQPALAVRWHILGGLGLAF